MPPPLDPPPPAAHLVLRDAFSGNVARDPMAARLREVYMPDKICNCKVSIEIHRGKGTAGLRLNCPNPREHPGCSRYRSLFEGTEVLGQAAAAKYLACWLSKSKEPAQTHRELKPSLEDVERFIRDNPDF